MDAQKLLPVTCVTNWKVIPELQQGSPGGCLITADDNKVSLSTASSQLLTHLVKTYTHLILLLSFVFPVALNMSPTQPGCYLLTPSLLRHSHSPPLNLLLWVCSAQPFSKSENHNYHSCLLLSRSPSWAVEPHSGMLVFPSTLYPNISFRLFPFHALLLFLWPILNLSLVVKWFPFLHFFFSSSCSTPTGNHSWKQRAIKRMGQQKRLLGLL